MKLDNARISHRLLATFISWAILFTPAVLAGAIFGKVALVGALVSVATWLLFFQVSWKWNPIWSQARRDGKGFSLDNILARIEPEA